MRKILAYSSAVLAASLFASGAQAVDTIVITGPSGTFGDDQVVCTGGAVAPCAFTRTFNFTTPAGFNIASATISSILAAGNPLTNINFSSVTLNGTNFNIVTQGDSEFRNLLSQNLIAGANNTISVMGTTGGDAAFSGTLSFAQNSAVPEPATWMFMLLGMGGIGYTMRRKDKTLRVRYT